MAACCTRWWRAPVYITVSVMLAFLAISTTLHSNSNGALPPRKPITNELSVNASRALREAGFNVFATLLRVSPELFLSSRNATIFAIKDPAIPYTSLPPWLLKDLLQYHTSPLSLTMDDLLKMPQGGCLPTLHREKNMALTRIHLKERLVEINHVFVSHPNIFFGGPISVHGVLGPFSPLDPQDVHQGWDIIQAPICDSNSTLVSDVLESKNMVEWSWIIRLLTSNGFVSFAIGLQYVLDDVLEDNRGLDSVTIFAPPNLPFLAFPSPLIKQIVRFHIVPQRFTYQELAGLPAGTLLMTLVPGLYLEVTGAVSFKRGMAINGVQIVAPDIFSSDSFIIHGISRAFHMVQLPKTVI
ncbi:hypothetical protein FEM48_Zijuj04G0080900 [Ziziphus jujuba var. spinosa]|uniref:FAS1 domain-containing protein n=1 Tax=Ziziphus jujuba var. spinosa TaxID=714518 RepID=A0A978VIR1_ZIZJJ|nr:hypothetical protein FEM48_Zijuj04G0080900 [Ziziphus jujuba var. spinosa]